MRYALLNSSRIDRQTKLSYPNPIQVGVIPPEGARRMGMDPHFGGGSTSSHKLKWEEEKPAAGSYEMFPQSQYVICRRIQGPSSGIHGKGMNSSSEEDHAKNYRLSPARPTPLVQKTRVLDVRRTAEKTCKASTDRPRPEHKETLDSANAEHVHVQRSLFSEKPIGTGRYH